MMHNNIRCRNGKVSTCSFVMNAIIGAFCIRVCNMLINIVHNTKCCRCCPETVKNSWTSRTDKPLLTRDKRHAENCYWFFIFTSLYCVCHIRSITAYFKKFIVETWRFSCEKKDEEKVEILGVSIYQIFIVMSTNNRLSSHVFKFSFRVSTISTPSSCFMVLEIMFKIILKKS